MTVSKIRKTNYISSTGGIEALVFLRLQLTEKREPTILVNDALIWRIVRDEA